jgi:hypothetical protein
VKAGFEIMISRDPGDQLSIADISLIESNTRRYGSAVTARQIVQDHHLLAARVEQFGYYTPYIPRAAGYQYRHVVLLCEKVKNVKSATGLLPGVVRELHLTQKSNPLDK